MNRKESTIFFVAIFIFMAAPPSLYCAPLPNINIHFLSRINMVKANQRFKLAVKFDIPKPWYIYAQNSGDVGVATQIKLSLPDGFTQEQIQWSPFQKIRKAGGLNAHVYQHYAIILFTLLAPTTLSADILKFKVGARWLACTENQCIPMKKQLSLRFPRQHVSRIQEQTLFKKWGNIMLPQH